LSTTKNHIVAVSIYPYNQIGRLFAFLVISPPLRVREKITSQFIALRFSSDLDYLNELNRKRNLSYTEDSVSEDRTKMV